MLRMDPILENEEEQKKTPPHCFNNKTDTLHYNVAEKCNTKYATT